MPFGSEKDSDPKTRKPVKAVYREPEKITPETLYGTELPKTFGEGVDTRSRAPSEEKPHYGPGKRAILEEAEKAIGMYLMFESHYPALKDGEVPGYWQWKRVCGHAMDVNEKKDEQLCSQCTCVFPESHQKIIKPVKKGKEVTCSFQGYLEMKDLENGF